MCLAILEEICPDQVQNLASVSLSASTKRRVEDLAADAFEKLKQISKTFTNFSISLDESQDVSHTSQLLIFICGV